MDPSPPIPLDAQGCPDWSALDFELRCPRCGYSLHMLTSPRCPECGLTFDWTELIEATRRMRRDSPLFEYRWRDRPIRALLATLWLCLRPWRLWRTVKLTDPPRVPVLCMLVLGVTLLTLLGIWLENFAFSSQLRSSGRPWSASDWSSTWSESWLIFATPLVWLLVCWSSIPILVLTLAALGVFRSSFLRHKVLWGHQVRIAVYSWTAFETAHCLVQLGASGCAIASIALGAGDGTAILALLQPFDWGAPLLFALSVYLGFRTYLRINRAALGTICIGALVTVGIVTAALTLMMQVDGHLGGGWHLPMRRLLPIDLLDALSNF